MEDELVRLYTEYILPVMLTRETLLTTAPVKVHVATIIRAVHFIIRRAYFGRGSSFSPLSLLRREPRLSVDISSELVDFGEAPGEVCKSPVDPLVFRRCLTDMLYQWPAA